MSCLVVRGVKGVMLWLNTQASIAAVCTVATQILCGICYLGIYLLGVWYYLLIRQVIIKLDC